jgi:DNA end-binding protein Ku
VNGQWAESAMPRGKGIMGTLLRYPYEVRDEKDYFGEIEDVQTLRT